MFQQSAGVNSPGYASPLINLGLLQEKEGFFDEARASLKV
jgi:hypothetical protein